MPEWQPCRAALSCLQRFIITCPSIKRLQSFACCSLQHCVSSAATRGAASDFSFCSQPLRLRSCALQVLWDSQPCVCGQVLDHREVVLQWARSHGHSLLHHHAPGESPVSTAGTAAALSLQTLVLVIAAALGALLWPALPSQRPALQASDVFLLLASSHALPA